MAKVLFAIGDEDVSRKAQEVGAEYILRITDRVFGDFITDTHHQLAGFWASGIVPNAADVISAVVTAAFDHATVGDEPALSFLASAQHDLVAMALPTAMMPHSLIIKWLREYAKDKKIEIFNIRNLDEAIA